MISVQTEPFTLERYNEMLPLIRKCWDECTALKLRSCAYGDERNETVVSPDYAQYQRMADSGALLYVTLRVAGRLEGYCIGFTYTSLHQKTALCGIADSLYVSKEHRKETGQVIDAYVEALKARKVEIIGWPTTPHGYVYKQLKQRGFVRDDVVMELRIK